MKYLYPVSLLLLLMISCQTDEKAIDREKTDWAHYKLEGNVLSVSEKSYEVANASLEKGKLRRENFSDHDVDLEFNEYGMLVSEKKWTGERPYEENKYNGRDKKLQSIQYIGGNPAINTAFSWDKAGKNNLSVIRRNPDNSQIDKIEKKYKDTLLIEKNTYNAQDNLTDKITYTYDKKGNLVGESLFLNTEMVQFKNSYQYDNNNNLVSESRYTKDEKPVYKTLHTYEGGLLKSSETYNENNEEEYVKKFRHDKKGNIIYEYTFEKFDGTETEEEFAYDAKGNKTQWVIKKNKELVSKLTYKYDDKGNLTGIEVTDKDGKIQETRSYKFEYDKTGNWVKKIISHNNKPQFTVERNITYFE